MAGGGKKFNIPSLNDVYGDNNAQVKSLFKAAKTATTSNQDPVLANNKHAIASTASVSAKAQGNIRTASPEQHERTVTNGLTSTNKQNTTVNKVTNVRTTKKVDLEVPTTSGEQQTSVRYDAGPSTSKEDHISTGMGTRDGGGTKLASGTRGPSAQGTGSTFLDAFGLPDEQLTKQAGLAAKPKEGPAVPRTTKSNSIIINPRQKGNPVIKNIRNVAWEFGDVVPDYVLGRTSCALFLSLRYHHLHPNYIQDRLQQLGHSYMLRILLVQVDVADPHHSLKELAKMCILADCTLILAWSPEEAGKYLETYKAYENKPADLIKEKTDKDYLSKATDFLTSIRSVNKTDVSTLVTTFKSIEGIIKASKEDLTLCPGFGPQKAKRVHDALHQPFLRSKKLKPEDRS